LILLFGFFAVLLDVFFAFMPSMRAQNDFLRAAAFGDFLACAALTGGFRFMP
jgi:hypothetical protein